MKRPRSVTVFVPKIFCKFVPNNGQLQHEALLGQGIKEICDLNREITDWLDNCMTEWSVDTRWHDGVSVFVPDDRNLVTLKLTWPQIIVIG